MPPIMQHKPTLITHEAAMNYSAKNGFNNLAEYLDFLHQNPLKITELQNGNASMNIPKQILFHGSSELITTLNPTQTIDANQVVAEDSLAYATPNANYAIFLAILHLKKGGNASVTITDEASEFSISDGFVNGESMLANGYVHIVSGEGFEETGNAEFISKQEVPVLLSVEVMPSDMNARVVVKMDNRES